MQGRILVVDDETTNRLVVREVLRQAGYEVDEATNGHEALDKISASLPDLGVEPRRNESGGIHRSYNQRTQEHA